MMVKSWNDYTDKDNVDFAKGEYDNFSVGQQYVIGSGKEPVM